MSVAMLFFYFYLFHYVVNTEMSYHVQEILLHGDTFRSSIWESWTKNDTLRSV